MFYRKVFWFKFFTLSTILAVIILCLSCDRVKHQMIPDSIDRSGLTYEREQEVNKAVLTFPDGEGIAEYQLAPEFSLLDAHDNLHKLSDYRGQVLVIVFLHDVTCYWCKFQLLKLESGYADIKAEGAEMIAITANGLPFVKYTQRESKITFPILSDPNMEVITAYNVIEQVAPKDHVEHHQGARPATLIIDSDGRILWSKLGYRYAYRTSPELVISKLKSYN